MGLATRQNIGAVGNGIFDMAADFFKSLLVNQRPLFNTIAGARPNGHAGRLFSKPFGKGIINAVLNKNPVCTNTCLASIAEFGQHRTFDSDIQIGIIKHQQRRVATQFEAHLFDRVSALAHQNPANLG